MVNFSQLFLKTAFSCSAYFCQIVNEQWWGGSNWLDALCHTLRSLNIREYVTEAAQYEAVNHKGLKSASLKQLNLSSAGWYLQENITVSNIQSPSLHLSSYPFPISTLSKIIIFILAASCAQFFLFCFHTIAVISCLLTHQLDVIYRHPNVRPNAVYFSISIRPPEHRHCYRAPPGFHHDTSGHSSVVKKWKASCWEAFFDRLCHLDL